MSQRVTVEISTEGAVTVSTSGFNGAACALATKQLEAALGTVVQDEKTDERKRLNEALELNKPLATAYYLKEDLRQFWNQSSATKAERFLDDWCRRADSSGIRVLQTMAKTLRTHRHGLLNWYAEPISSGPIEGINNKIGALQRRAYGYRNYEHLKLRILTLHHAKFSLTG